MFPWFSAKCPSSSPIHSGKKNELDDGWPESLEEHSERCKYEDLMA